MAISRAVKNYHIDRLFYWGLLDLDSSKREDYALQCSSRDLYRESEEAGKALVNLQEKLSVSVMASFLTMRHF